MLYGPDPRDERREEDRDEDGLAAFLDEDNPSGDLDAQEELMVPLEDNEERTNGEEAFVDPEARAKSHPLSGLQDCSCPIVRPSAQRR